MRTIRALFSAAALAGAGCLTSGGVTPDGGAKSDPSTGGGSAAPSSDGGSDASTVDRPSGTGLPPLSGGGVDPAANPASADAILYRAPSAHPGCTTDGLDARAASAYVAAAIPGYPCAAKEYPPGPAGEDASKPIVILVHGNSSTPADYEKFPAGDPAAVPMLSELLVAAGYHTFAVDMRYDRSDDPTGNNDTENVAKNFDHAWGVPIVEKLIAALMAARPQRRFSIVAFSLGPTVVRDALRRLHRDRAHPFERLDSLVFAAGGHHGVSTFRALCGKNPTMRGRVACEMGDRTAFQPTDFLKPLNGPSGAFETPCADGSSAFGQVGACGAHKVRYTTLVMQDVKEGTYQDEFVSQGSSQLAGAQNLTVTLSDTDPSGYFYKGLFKSHYGAIRSEAALKAILAALAD